MAKRKRPTACTLKRRLRAQGVDFSSNFHALRSSDVRLVLDAAKEAGYRKAKNAPGSRARMYFQYLARKKGC